MKKVIMAFAAMLFAVASWAAGVDANKASEAELGTLKGVGPAMSKRIVDTRKEGAFKDWADFMARVKGVKEKSAARLSSEGLTVNGKTFSAAPAATQVARSESKVDPRKAAVPAGKAPAKP